MHTNTLRISLDALREEGSSIETRVAELKNELALAEQRLAHIRGAIQNLQFIVGDLPAASRIENLAPEVEIPQESDNPFADIADLFENPDETEPHDESKRSARSGVKRTPSTDWLAEIVNASGRVLTRNEVFEEYERQKGFPESWTNPRNSLGNALNRAVSKKMITRLPGDQYASIDFDLFADPAPARQEGRHA